MRHVVFGARRHYEIWDSTPNHADLVGDTDTLRGALVAYVRARRAAGRDHTIHVLTDDLPVGAGGVS